MMLCSPLQTHRLAWMVVHWHVEVRPTVATRLATQLVPLCKWLTKSTSDTVHMAPQMKYIFKQTEISNAVVRCSAAAILSKKKACRCPIQWWESNWIGGLKPQHFCFWGSIVPWHLKPTSPPMHYCKRDWQCSKTVKLPKIYSPQDTV